MAQNFKIFQFHKISKIFKKISNSKRNSKFKNFSKNTYIIKGMVEIYDIMNTLYTLLFKYIIKCIKHGKICIICHITLDQYYPSGLKALWMILVSRDDTAYDTCIILYLSYT